MIKEIPILFSTPMVQAEKEGRKTMTRRTTDLESINERPDDWEFVRFEDNAKGGLNAVFKRKDSILITSIPCRYGRSGDLLWVRESWQLKGWNFEDGGMNVRYATGETSYCNAHDPSDDSEWLMNHVDKLERRGYITPDTRNKDLFVFTDKKQPFNPSIHMPKVAARIWLQVESVRVERLKDITDNDAIAEGIESYTILDDLIAYKNYSATARKDFLNKSRYQFDNMKEIQSGPVASFCTLWISINGRESWISNPWVWAISFKVLSTTGKPDLTTINK